jgi:hypothetical protein
MIAMTNHPRRRRHRRTPVHVIADYHQTPTGTWTALIDGWADGENSDGGWSTQTAAPTLPECHQKTVNLVQKLATANHWDATTMHTIDENPTKFVQEYTTQVPLQGTWLEIEDAAGKRYIGPGGTILHLT